MKKYYYRLKNKKALKQHLEIQRRRKNDILCKIRSISFDFTNHIAAETFYKKCKHIIDVRYNATESIMVFDGDRKLLDEDYFRNKCEQSLKYNAAFEKDLEIYTQFKNDFITKDSIVLGGLETTKPSHWVNPNGVMDTDDIFVNVHEIHCGVYENFITSDCVINVKCWDDVTMFCIKDMYIRDGFLYIVTHDDGLISYDANMVRLSEPSIIDKVDFIAGENVNIADVQRHRNAIIAEIKKGGTLLVE